MFLEAILHVLHVNVTVLTVWQTGSRGEYGGRQNGILAVESLENLGGVIARVDEGKVTEIGRRVVTIVTTNLDEVHHEEVVRTSRYWQLKLLQNADVALRQCNRLGADLWHTIRDCVPSESKNDALVDVLHRYEGIRFISSDDIEVGIPPVVAIETYVVRRTCR